MSEATGSNALTLPGICLETATRVLKNLDHLLQMGADNAHVRGFDGQVLYQSRLAPDMFPLSRQVQIACDTVKNGIARLAGQTPPRFDDTETTIPELQARIRKTLDLVASHAPAELEGDPQREVTFPIGKDRTMSLSASDYLLTWMLPNLYFHVTTAYNILRHNGVPVGKVDYLRGSQV